MSIEKVIIHDNRTAIERALYAHGLHVSPLIRDRWIQYDVEYKKKPISLFATGAGCGQTNLILEFLARQGTTSLVKIGTCSALQDGLNDGDVIVPRVALDDEGATKWHVTQHQHSAGAFSTPTTTQTYICSRNCVTGSGSLITTAIASLGSEKDVILREDCGNAVWSVDSYDLFDQCPSLYYYVDGRTYPVPQLGLTSTQDIQIAGVEMECSIFLSRTNSLGIDAVAILIVSRSRNYLLNNNAAHFPPGFPYTPPTTTPTRNTPLIQQREITCFRIAMDIV